jgi:hypothetical protein
MIGILTPYGRNEVTAAALALADVIHGRGEEVRLASAGGQEEGIHPHWDTPSPAAPGWDSACDAVICFGGIPHYKTSTILVPGWEYLPGANMLTDVQIVCPNAFYYASFKAAGAPLLHLCPWGSGIGQPTTRTGPARKGRTYVLFWCNNTIIDTASGIVIETITELLRRLPEVSITVASTRTWPRRSRAAWNKLLNRYPLRLECIPLGGHVEQLRALYAADWIVVPSLADAFGMAALRALATGAPVIAYAGAPYSSIIKPGENGFLAAASLPYNSTLPTIVPEPGSLLKTCLAAFTSPAPRHKLGGWGQLKSDWSMEENDRQFASFWVELLDI